MIRKTPKPYADLADIVVAIYRHTSDGLDYCDPLVTAHSVAISLPEGLPALFDSVPDGPVVSRETLDRLERKLNKAIAEMLVGRLVDISIALMINGELGNWGFHRLPTATDRDFDSILTIQINRFGSLSEFRRRPSDVEMTMKSAVFGIEVNHG